jgi:hypothetical protein
MHPFGRDLLCRRELYHVHRRRVAALPARSALQRGLKFPDRRIPRPADGIERQAHPGRPISGYPCSVLENGTVPGHIRDMAIPCPKCTVRAAIGIEGEVAFFGGQCIELLGTLYVNRFEWCPILSEAIAREVTVTINGCSWGGHHASPRFKGASDRFGFVSYFLPSTHVCIAGLVSVLTTLIVSAS